MTRIPFVGQKLETVDFSDPPLPPGFDSNKINVGSPWVWPRSRHVVGRETAA